MPARKQEGFDKVVELKKFNRPRSLPRALTIRRSDFSLHLLGKVIVVFVFLGPILVPLLWLTNIPFFQGIARFGWSFGASFCTYTAKSFVIGGSPMMVCARCFGAACGILLTGLTYFYTPWLQKYLPKRKLYLAAFLAALFIPWLLDSGLERLHLWLTDYWLMVPTGMLGGAAVTLAPLLFWPRSAAVDEDE